jgi:hypothetical protein
LERPFLDNADISQRHLFVPSWRDKNETLNALELYKFSYIGGSRKSHNEAIFKRNSYVKEFLPPFKINDENLENYFNELDNWINENKVEDVNQFYGKNKELDSIVKKIYDSIPYVNHSVFANMLMRMFFDFNLNQQSLIVYLEQEILNSLHHLSIEDICKIHYVAKIFSPKHFSAGFPKILLTSVQEKLPGMNLNQLYCVLFGFRMHRDKSFFDNIVNILIEKKNHLLKKDNSNIPANIARIFYSYASNKPKHYGIQTFYAHKEVIEKLIMAYDNDLLENILKMDQHEVCRLTHALYLLKYESVDLYLKYLSG